MLSPQLPGVFIGSPGSCAFQAQSFMGFSGRPFPEQSSTVFVQSRIHCWYTCQLRSVLQGNRAKTGVLIFTRKIRCFLNIDRFWSFFRLPVGSSTKIRNFRTRNTSFYAFSDFSNWKLRGKGSKGDGLKPQLPGLCEPGRAKGVMRWIDNARSS